MFELSNPAAPVAAMAHPDEIVVLLIDDQPIVGEAIRRLLADQGHIRFHYCDEAAGALAAAREIEPTVILQDLVMPGVDGLRLLLDYRADPGTKDIPIIVLSTKEDPAVKRDAFARGANDYLIKLPDKVELIARIQLHSKAFLNAKQRDEAYRALHESQALLVEKNLELERLTNIDALTGLSNRRNFNDFTDVQWRQAAREGRALSILMIDVDDFKRYNDSYGHLAGDEVLKTVAETVRACCARPTDLVARFGGEEFIVCLSSPLAGALVVAERIRHAVEIVAIAHRASSVGPSVTISVGCAAAQPRPGDSILPLIEAADVALYEAKRSGKNRVGARREPSS